MFSYFFEKKFKCSPLIECKGFTLLMQAVINGDVKMVEEILNNP